VANSGSAEGSGLYLQNVSLGTMTVAVTKNTIRWFNNFGIYMQTGGGGSATSGILNATITGNTIANPGTTPGTSGFTKNGIHLNVGTFPGDTFQVCTKIGGAGALANSITGSGLDGNGGANNDFRLRQRQSTTVRLPGYTGANNNNAAVVTFVQGNNGTTPTGIASNTVATGGGGFTGSGTTCP
jgi:hypothetical protein